MNPLVNNPVVEPFEVPATGTDQVFTPQETEADGVSHEETHTSSGNDESVGQTEIAQNDCIATEAELIEQINVFYKNIKDCDFSALVNAWEAGNRLLKLRDLARHGTWVKFVEANFSISYSTVRRYCYIAEAYSRLEELEGRTLSGVYEELFGAGKVPEEDDGIDEESVDRKVSSKKPRTAQAKLLTRIAKASKKFNEPTSLSQGEKSAVKTFCLKLEEVYGRIHGPSILGINWQQKLHDDVSNLTEEEIALFRQEMGKLKTVETKVDAASKPESKEESVLASPIQASV